MMELQIWKQRREELIREADQARMAKRLRESRKRGGGGGLASSVVWEIKRIAGRLRKLG